MKPGASWDMPEPYYAVDFVGPVSAAPPGGVLNPVAILKGMVNTVEVLIHIHRRFIALRFADDTRWHASGGGMRWNGLQHHGTGANLRAAPHFDD